MHIPMTRAEWLKRAIENTLGAVIIVLLTLTALALLLTPTPAFPQDTPPAPTSATTPTSEPTPLIPSSLGAGAVDSPAAAPASRPNPNEAPPVAEAELGVVSTYTDGAWQVGPRLYVYGEAGPSIGQATPVRVFAEAALGLRTGDDPTSPDGAAAIASATSVRGAVGISRVIGSREYPADTDSDDQRPRRVLTSIYGKAGGEFSIDQESNLEPRVAKVVEGGLRVQVWRASQETADVWVGVGYDQSAVPAEPVVLSDGSISRSIQVIVSGKLPVVRKGALAGALIGRIVTNMIRSDGDGRHDRVELGAVVSWD